MDMARNAEYTNVQDQILRLKLEEPYNFNEIRHLQQQLDQIVKNKIKTNFCVQNLY